MTGYPKPVVFSEKGYDQTAVPSENANAEPGDETLEAAKLALVKDESEADE